MERTTFYTTIENQIREDGSKGLLYDHFEDENRAYAKYFTVCAAAAMSGIPYHSAHIIRSDGIMIEGKVFDRRSDEPEPEPEQVEEE
jgi:hypothetical protein